MHCTLERFTSLVQEYVRGIAGHLDLVASLYNFQRMKFTLLPIFIGYLDAVLAPCLAGRARTVHVFKADAGCYHAIFACRPREQEVARHDVATPSSTA